MGLRLTRIKIKGYRSIIDQETTLECMSGIVGKNSAGKSTILNAILQLLTETKFKEEDYHQVVGQEHNEIEITGEFYINGEELEEIKRILKYKTSTLTIIKRGDGEKSTHFMKVKIPTNQLLQSSYPSTKTKKEYKDAVENGSLPDYFGGDEGKFNIGDIKSAISKYMDEHEVEMGEEKIIPMEKSLFNILPEPLYVPAFENIDKQVKYQKTNLFGKLLSMVIQEIAESSDPDYKRWNTSVNNLTSRLFARGGKRPDALVSFEKSLSNYIQQILPTEVVLDFNLPNMEELLLNAFALKLDDGILTNVTQKGHGAQRAVIWSLLRNYLDTTKSKDKQSVMFLVEEPELYLHPQAQRVMLNVLTELSSINQVIYSTHSPIFVDLSNPKQIRLIKKEKRQSVIYAISEKVLEKKKYDINFLTKMNNESAELFFAQSVILYEGATEQIILNHMNQNAPSLNEIEPQTKADMRKNFDELGCQIINTSGKFSMPFFIHVLNDLKIPYFVIFDKDNQSKAVHEETNTHINNGSKYTEGRPNGSIQYIPTLEPAWGLYYESSEKLPGILNVLNNMDNPEFDKAKKEYEFLKKLVYSFAYAVYRNKPFKEHKTR
ncbi:MAG: AAA family ATPase [Candidatus Heimdallarchaeota archaeon]|nr:AAA family ATPase [Candidatus Heimdallarchaeota archaeon]